MMEMKIKIEVPDLAAAIAKLADALTPPDPHTLTPDMPVGAPVPPVAVAPAPTPATPPAAPVNPTPAPTAPAPAPVAGPSAPAPGNTPAPAVPVAGAPTYTLDQISRAGASLVDAGKMQQLLELLGRYGVQAVTQLKPEQYGAFATELRGLGAQI